MPLATAGPSPRARGAQGQRFGGRCGKAHPRIGRGAREPWAGLDQVGGTIPAGAGSTRSRCWCPSRRGDHPRRRGKHMPYMGLRSRVKGTSPRKRGARADRLVGHLLRGAIPAGAGSTAAASRTATSARVHTRKRGALRAIAHFDDDVGAIPRTTGSTSPTSDRAPYPRTSPRTRGVREAPASPCECATRDGCRAPATSRQAPVPGGKPALQLLLRAPRLAISGIWRSSDFGLLASCLVQAGNRYEQGGVGRAWVD